MALISKGAELIFDNKKNDSGSAAFDAFIESNTEFAQILNKNNWAFPGLQEIGAINIAGAGGSYDQIEVTTLADIRHRYVDGLIADTGANNNQIACKFLYDPAIFKAFTVCLENEMEGEFEEKTGIYIINIPDGGHFELEASIASVNMDTITTNSALTFSVNFAVKDIAMKSTQYTVTVSE